EINQRQYSETNLALKECAMLLGRGGGSPYAADARVDRPSKTPWLGGWSSVLFDLGRVQGAAYRPDFAIEFGKDLPAILGLDSMHQKRAIAGLETGQERRVFPGQGTVDLELPAGAQESLALIGVFVAKANNLDLDLGELGSRQALRTRVGRELGRLATPMFGHRKTASMFFAPADLKSADQ
ncbi:unnamed protein product, partial [Prorocentrum cordatum]